MTTQSSWLPNLVGGVSIWKLAVDLNEPRFFDGRLLIPETEGSDRLPASVTWNVQGMLPLAEAKARYPDQTAAAIRDFAACVEKVQAELADPASGYKKYKDAFSVPALDGSAGAESANYYYAPTSQKLFVTNWGASPRSIAGRDKVVFGYDAFGSFVEHAKKEGAIEAAPIASSDMATAGVVAAGGVVEAPAQPPVEEAKKPEEKKKDDDKARPWWIWLLLILALGLLIALILFLLRSCEKHRLDVPDAGVFESLIDGGALGADGSANEQMKDAASALDGDANDGGKDASASDGSADGVGAGSGNGFAVDGGVLIFDGHGVGLGLGLGAGSGDGKGVGSGSGSGSGAGSGKGGPGDKNGPGDLAHRVHVEPKAMKWRVVAGKDALDPSSPTEGSGMSFDIALKPGRSGEGVKVQWQDGDGKWHNF